MKKKKYVISNLDTNNQIVVSITDGEAKAIDDFIAWACIDDDYLVESVDEHEAADWGEEQNVFDKGKSIGRTS